MTDELDPKTVATLDAMLDAAGIVATPAEREQLLAMYA
jgi:hypothetical protein